MVLDQIADFLTRIRNGVKAQHRYIECDWSKMRQGIAKILKEQGFIENYLVKKENDSRGTIRVFLKFGQGRQPAIQGIKRVSKPGWRRYVGHHDIPKFYGGMGLSILSTSEGVLDGHEAQKRKIGGELLCFVW